MAFTLKKHTSNQLESARLNDVNQNWTDIETAIDALQTDVDENFGRLETEVDLLKGEVIPVTLTNSSPYPFNNSVQTISLTKEKPSTDYYVDVELISATGGSVGNFRVTDKLLNSFKLAFDGGATSVSVICRVKGGI